MDSVLDNSDVGMRHWRLKTTAYEGGERGRTQALQQNEVGRAIKKKI